MINHRFIAIGVLLIGLSACSSKPLTRQEQAYETAVFRLNQLRDGGVAVLPIRVTLTLPPGLAFPPIWQQQRLEQSMTEALMKLHKDLRVIPPAKTLNVLGQAGAGTTSLERKHDVGASDSLAVDRDILARIQERTGCRFVMEMAFISGGSFPPLNREGSDRGHAVVCQIWDAQTARVVWRARHPWPVLEETATNHSEAAMQQLCADLLARLPPIEHPDTLMRP